MISPKHRGLILIRPAIFLVVRIAMLVLRAIMSKKSYGETELSELRKNHAMSELTSQLSSSSWCPLATSS